MEGPTNTNLDNNDLLDLLDERVDTLSALLTVSAEQLDDRLKAEKLLAAGAHRSTELIEAVFGSTTPSVRSYLDSHRTLEAA